MSLRFQLRSLVLIVLSVVLLITLVPGVYAHGDEVHDESEEVSVEHMQDIIQILNQIIVLLTQYRSQYGVYTPAPVAPISMPIVPVTPAAAVEETEENTDDDHGAHIMATTPSPALVIEIEPHNGMTHAHVRYTDKPEEMFFVEPHIDDEDGIVAALVAKTGLSADVVRPALKYMQ
jgi:hypothetical protein